MDKKLLVIAHRGASDFLPDNTILSFDRATVERADMIELDVRKTADGRLVLYHDWYMRYPCNANKGPGISRMVSHSRYKQLQRCCEESGFQLATLDEVLERYGGRIAINIELKAGGYEQEVIDLIHKYALNGSVVLSSFIPWVIKKLKDIDGSIKTGWIVGQEQIIKANYLVRALMVWLFGKLDADSAHLHYEMVTPEILERFHSRNTPVYAWTVNDLKIMKNLIDIGVDGIITNKPGKLHAVLNNTAVSELPISEFDLRAVAIKG
jgi:glycerophosphoryl diester phosphodiesterase